MELNLLPQVIAKGIALGLAIAAPVGPIGILCIKRTLNQGWTIGLASGLGAATADALYGCIAGFGWVAIAQALTNQAFWLKLLGGLFLIYLGCKTAAERPRDGAGTSGDSLAQGSRLRSDRRPSLLAAYGSTLGLTLTNPATIFAFIAIFAGLGEQVQDQAQAAPIGQSLLMVLGIFCGSALWWLLLASITHQLHRQITPRQLRWINRGSGLVLVGFGIWVIASQAFLGIAQART